MLSGMPPARFLHTRLLTGLLHFWDSMTLQLFLSPKCEKPIFLIVIKYKNGPSFSTFACNSESLPHTLPLLTKPKDAAIWLHWAQWISSDNASKGLKWVCDLGLVVLCAFASTTRKGLHEPAGGWETCETKLSSSQLHWPKEPADCQIDEWTQLISAVS